MKWDGIPRTIYVKVYNRPSIGGTTTKALYVPMHRMPCL